MGTPVVENKNRLAAILFCAPTGIRTPVVALKGLRPGPLDDGGGCTCRTLASDVVCGGMRLPKPSGQDFIIPTLNWSSDITVHFAL